MDLEPQIEASWSLSTIPPEIFGFVSLNLDVEDLVACILVGNTRLTRLVLAPGAVPSLSCGSPVFRFRQQSLFFFLRMLPNLSTLAVCAVRWELKSNDWVKFPPTLSRLDIFDSKYCDSPSSFFWCASFPTLRYLAFPGGLELESSNLLPPTLETLKIQWMMPQCPLPDSLTSLKLLGEYSLHVLVSPLPNLRHLLVKFQDDLSGDFEAFFRSLPPSLARLELREAPERPDALLAQLLPQGLQTLQWTTNLDLSRRSRRTGPLIVFPSRLTHLELDGNTPIEHFAPFPTSVRHISLGPLLAALPLPIPPNLESFSQLGFNEGSNTKIPTLSNTLTSLSTPQFQYHISDLSAIPRSVTRLHVGEITADELTSTEKLVWPPQTLNFPNLTHFLWEHSNTDIPASLYRCLAIGCPKLILCAVSHAEIRCRLDSNSDSREEIENQNHLDWLESFSCFASESGATSSDVASTSSLGLEGPVEDSVSTPIDSGVHERPNEPPFKFQHGLKSFWAHLAPFGDELLATLPVTSITSLVLPQSPFITDVCFRDTIQYCLSLKELNCPSPTVTGSAFIYLPRNLVSFSLPHSKDIFDDDICHIPRTITKLDFESATQLTEASGPFWPKNLRVLNIFQNATVTTAFVSHFTGSSMWHLETNRYVARVHHGAIEIL